MKFKVGDRVLMTAYNQCGTIEYVLDEYVYVMPDNPKKIPISWKADDPTGRVMIHKAELKILKPQKIDPESIDIWENNSK